jgi:hypothetical protein
MSAIYFPSGSKVPRLQTTSIDLSKTTCTPFSSADADKQPELEFFPDGQGYQASIEPGKKVTLPDGVVAETDTKGESVTETDPDGLKTQYFFDEDGLVKGIQIYSPSGEKLAPGQKITLPDGRVIEQPPL